MLATEKYGIWMDNPEWYDFDENDQPFLTEKAPPEAIESFKAYLELKKLHEETGIFY